MESINNTQSIAVTDSALKRIKNVDKPPTVGVYVRGICFAP